MPVQIKRIRFEKIIQNGFFFYQVYIIVNNSDYFHPKLFPNSTSSEKQPL